MREAGVFGPARSVEELFGGLCALGQKAEAEGSHVRETLPAAGPLQEIDQVQEIGGRVRPGSQGREATVHN